MVFGASTSRSLDEQRDDHADKIIIISNLKSESTQTRDSSLPNVSQNLKRVPTSCLSRTLALSNHDSENHTISPHHLQAVRVE